MNNRTSAVNRTVNLSSFI